MKNKYASTTSLKLVPDYDQLYDQGIIPQQPSIQVVYCFKKCQIVAGVCKCTITKQTAAKLENFKNQLKKSQNFLGTNQQFPKKQENDQTTVIKGGDEKIKGVLKKKSFKVYPEHESKQPKKIQFDIPRQIKPLKTSLKSSLLNSILQCLLNAKGLEFNQKQFRSKSLPFNSFNQLKQLKDSYCSQESGPVSTERINSILQGKKQYKDCYQFLTKMLEKLINDNKSYEKLNSNSNSSKDKAGQVLNNKSKISLLAKKSLMEQMFQIQIQKVYNCAKCKLSFVKSINENFIDLHLYKQKDIELVLQKQFNKKPIADKCNSCSAIAKLTASKLFKKLPSFLILALHHEIIANYIQPAEQLQILVNNSKVVYQFHSLIATVDHSHYYSIIQNATTNEWYKFDDENIMSLGKRWQSVKIDTIVFVNYQIKQTKKQELQTVRIK